ncbi:DEAD/DEAH box helicase [Cloacibacillus porcorum]|nr:DEAD/DEAH box helicase [Cloacibacillus porcorum]
MALRDYQQRAITMLFTWLKYNPGNPCIVMPTGSGKSHVIAELCKNIMLGWPQSRILILSHVKELLQQDAEKIMLAWPEAPLGIYSAGMGSRDIGLPITVAGIQSVRDKAEMLGFVDITLVDEAHLISHKAEGGYRTLLEALKAKNPNMRIVGLTATPYRLGHGLISEHGAIFDDLIEPVQIAELVARGFLAPLRSKLPGTVLSTEGVGKRGGEYIEHELQAAVNNADDNDRIVEEVIRRAGDRKAWLFFCTGVAHAEAIRNVLRSRGVVAEVVTGATPKTERDRIIADYKAGRIKALTNADVLTTGFDYPDIDLIALCRPTMSPGLYIQMAGRGMRLKSHTDHCLVLDFAGNVKRHGPITEVKPPKHKGAGTGDAPVKVCDECAELVHASVKVCPCCGYEFPAAPKEAVKLHDDDIMSLEPEEMRVRSWWWYIRQSKTKQINMLCVDYENAELTGDKVTEYITILHDGYARYRAKMTLRAIIDGCGADISTLDGESENYLDDIAEVLNSAKAPDSITIKKDGRYYRVLERRWTPAVGA